MSEEMEMKAEFGAHLRTTQGDLFLNTLKNIKFKDKNSTEQFYTLVDAAFNLMIQNEIDFISDMISESDTNTLNETINFVDLKIKKNSSNLTPNIPQSDTILNIKNWKDLAQMIGYSPVNSGISTIFSINSGYNLGVNFGKIIINRFL